jgi:hypothetical protein
MATPWIQLVGSECFTVTYVSKYIMLSSCQHPVKAVRADAKFHLFAIPLQQPACLKELGGVCCSGAAQPITAHP